MDVANPVFEVFGQNNVKLGWMDARGTVRSDGVIIFQLVAGRIYSMHGRYLGRLVDERGMTDRGELIFTLSAVR
jgi:hypothetical protein